MVDYQPGQKLNYHEDGGIFRVKVLENNSDEGREAYRLKVLEVVKSSPIVRNPRLETEFNCEKIRDLHIPFALWELSDDISPR